MTERKVEQRDREAAADWRDSVWGYSTSAAIRSGDEDHSFVYALAAHRLAERRAIVEWLRDRSNHRHPDLAFAAVFATAIEAGAHVGGLPNGVGGGS